MLPDPQQYDIDITTGSYVRLAYEKASPMRRIMAVAIDWTAIYIVFCGILFLLANTGLTQLLERLLNDEEFADTAIFLIFAFITSFADLTCEYVFNGRTLGKMLLKTQVMTDDCKPPSLLQCLMRWITFPIDMSLIGLILISRKGKRIGDIASGCNVVKSAMGVVGKVSSEGYFDFADPGYKPRHPNAYTLSDKDRELVRKAVHNRLYKAYRKEVAEHISDVLRIVKMEDDLEFLAHIEQDCKYFDNLGGGAERAAGGEAAS